VETAVVVALLPARSVAVALGVQVKVPPVAAVAARLPLKRFPIVTVITGPFSTIVAVSTAPNDDA
jgi:type IV secretory pathway VirB2 component (pilin)